MRRANWWPPPVRFSAAGAAAGVPAVPTARLRNDRRAQLSPARLRHESVAYTPHREQMLRIGRLGLDVAAQPDDEVVDRPRVGVFVLAPHLLEHRLSRHRLAFAGR